MSGKIVELLAEEESTVTVGQDLLRIEPGEGSSTSSDESPNTAPEKGARSEPKNPEEGNKDQAAPEADKEKGAGDTKHAKQEEKAPGMEKSEGEKPAPKKEEKSSAPQPAPKKDEKKSSEQSTSTKAVGSRNETRVSDRKFYHIWSNAEVLPLTGQDVTNATNHLPTSQGFSKRRCFSHHVQRN